MSILKRPLPDLLEKPVAQAAASRIHTEAVLAFVAKAGSGVLALVTGLLSAAMILYSGYVLYDTVYTENKAISSAYDLLQYRPEIIDDGATPLAGGDTLVSINRDYRSWITLYDTNIDYPVMQGEDDQYYATHDVYKNTSLTGAIYLASANNRTMSDNYNLIYGHHMDNGAMFGALDRYADESYFAAHRKGLLVSTTTVYDLNVFAVVSTDAYNNSFYRPGNADIGSLLGAIEAQAVLADMSAAAGATQIVGLSTCADATTNGRLIVFAAMFPRDMSFLPEESDPSAGLVLTLTGYRGSYDGQSHSPGVSVNREDAELEYSIDGGETWTDELPSIRNVGTLSVTVHATHALYGDVTAETVMRIDHAQAAVRANPAFRRLDEADPALSATVQGLFGEDSLNYTLSLVGVRQAVGTYADAIVPEGDQVQGNYMVTYYPAEFRILPNLRTLELAAQSVSAVYDGKPHTIPVTVSLEDALVEYSTDGGATWSTQAPSLTDVGSLSVQIRATAENCNPVSLTATLEITPRPVTVSVKDAARVENQGDPAFTVEINGVIDGYEIRYTIVRDQGEAPGTYEVRVQGDAQQGNYAVTFVSGRLTITQAVAPPAAHEPEETTIAETAKAEEPAPEFFDITDPETPLGNFFEQLRPSGGTTISCWALLNLLMTLMTVYLVLPITHLQAKFGRNHQMAKINALHNGTLYDVKKSRVRFWIGFALECLLGTLSVWILLVTENFGDSMTLIDKWTPLMLLFMVLTWVVDMTLTGRETKADPEEPADR